MLNQSQAFRKLCSTEISTEEVSENYYIDRREEKVSVWKKRSVLIGMEKTLDFPKIVNAPFGNKATC